MDDDHRKDGLRIPGEWSFNREDVASQFDSHVREQLPWYDLVSKAVGHIARHFIPRGGVVYDIGASTGNIGRVLGDCIEERRATLIPIEASPEMASRYEGAGRDHLLQIDALDIDYRQFDVAILNLILMFVPVMRQAAFLNKLRGKMNEGGAIIIVDKMESDNGYVASIMARLTLAGKVETGVPTDRIIAKELSLAGVQRPINPAVLGKGARLWFRFGEFAGWIITHSPPHPPPPRIIGENSLKKTP